MGFLTRLIKLPLEIVKDVVEEIEEVVEGKKENE